MQHGGERNEAPGTYTPAAYDYSNGPAIKAAITRCSLDGGHTARYDDDLSAADHFEHLRHQQHPQVEGLQHR